MKPIHEVYADFTDDDNYTHIDVYHSSDENAEGKTVAIVCNDTSKVFFIDNMYRTEQIVKGTIDEVVKQINLVNSYKTDAVTTEIIGSLANYADEQTEMGGNRFGLPMYNMPAMIEIIKTILNKK